MGARWSSWESSSWKIEDWIRPIQKRQTSKNPIQQPQLRMSRQNNLLLNGMVPGIRYCLLKQQTQSKTGPPISWQLLTDSTACATQPPRTIIAHSLAASIKIYRWCLRETTSGTVWQFNQRLRLWALARTYKPIYAPAQANLENETISNTNLKRTTSDSRKLNYLRSFKTRRRLTSNVKSWRLKIQGNCKRYLTGNVNCECLRLSTQVSAAARTATRAISVNRTQTCL